MRGTRWFHGGGNLSIQVGVFSLCGEEGRQTAALLRGCTTRILEAHRLRYEFLPCTFGARSCADSAELFDHPLFDRHARNFRQQLAHAQLPHLRLKFELPYGWGR